MRMPPSAANPVPMNQTRRITFCVSMEHACARSMFAAVARMAVPIRVYCKRQ